MIGVCSHCLSEKQCRVWRRPVPAKITFTPPSITNLPRGDIETLICEKCLQSGSTLTVYSDVLDAEFIDA